LEEIMDLGRFVLRGVVGPLFVGHGTQKLFGWFGGHGLDTTGGFFENLGLRPGKRHATAAGVAEAGGGLLLTLGALTPLTSAAITGTMVTAIRKVHWSKGPWVTDGGYEYNLALIAAVTALTEAGPGRPSVDGRLFPNLNGSGWALASVAAGVAGSYLATEVFSEPAPVQAPEPAAAPTTADDELAAQPRFERDTDTADRPA
jgi:putative oxidoreductase